MSATQYGYARVSSLSQSTAIQEERLGREGCEVIRTEKVSGRSKDNRTELQTLLDFIREGDTLMVTKVDRLGRNTRDVLNIVHELEKKGAHLRVLDPDVSTKGPMGKIVLTVLGMVGEMELGFIRERQREGIERAKARGVYKGRPATLDHQRVAELHQSGVGATAIAKELGCSRAAVYKVLAGAGAKPTSPAG